MSDIIEFGPAPAKAGGPVPRAKLAWLDEDRLRIVDTGAQFAKGKSVIVGVVGAFTPSCNERHVPEFVERAGELAARGYPKIYCIAPNDPWIVQVWSQHVDPRRRLIFLSDGNLEFATALGVLTHFGEDLFLGARNHRYLLLVEDGTITRLSVETDPITLACTTSRQVA